MSRLHSSDRAQIRSERISLALTRAAFDGVKTLATMRNTTVNDFVASLVENVVTKNAPVIEEFTAAQKKFVASLDLKFDSCKGDGGGDDRENT